MLCKELKTALQQVTAPLDQARGLPNQTYTDDQLFIYERDAVIGKSWSAFCFASELKNQSYALPINFMGLPLLAVRDNQDEIRVFHNACLHRGMKLVDQAQTLKNVIRCPYHSWAYQAAGDLISTPHIGGQDQHHCEGFEKSGRKLKQVRSTIWMGVVFINLSGDAPDFMQHNKALRNRWQTFMGQDGYQQLSVGEYDCHLEMQVNCNWKLAVENYCESYHLPWVHPDLNNYSPMGEHYNIMIDETMSGQGSLSYRLAGDSDDRLPLISHWPKEKLDHAEYISFYPNLLLGLQVDHAFAMILQPLAAGKTLEKLELSYVGDAADDKQYLTSRQTVLKAWRQVFQEDIFAIEGMQQGRASPGFDGGLFTPIQDVPTHHFHHWVASKYLAESTKD